MSNPEAPRRQRRVKIKCGKCYDKGYSTVFSSIRTYPDFIGDKGHLSKPRIRIKFCNCSRGKQLERLIKANYTKKKW